jgi:uncharacterized membrane protein YdjX (TVP38/TMEM64 family)
VSPSAPELPPTPAGAVGRSRAAAVARALGWARFALVAGVALGLVVAHRLGLFDALGEPTQLRQALLDLGAWGYAAFVLAYALLQPFGVPGMVFLLAAPLVWPWPVAYALTLAGTLGASVVGFSFARFVGRDLLAGRVPARFRAYDQALARKGLLTVFALRFVFWMHPLLHAFFGVSQVSFGTHLLGSLAGYALPLLATAYFGHRAYERLRQAPGWSWAPLAGLVILLLAAAALRRARTRAPTAGD